jgi:hypothetical protein
MRIQVTEDGLVIPKELLAGIQAMDIHQEQNRIVLTPTQEAKPETATYVPQTPLGKRLWSLRQEAIAAGMKLLSAEEIEQEIAEQRHRHQDLYENLP